MKKKTVASLLGIGAAAYLGVKNHQAAKENRSLRSKLIEDSIDKLIKVPDYRKEENFQAALKTSGKGFHLPNYIRNLYGFHYAQGYDNTLELMPKGGDPKQTIVYFHGGAYWLDPMQPHFSTLKKIANHTNSRIIMPIYPKSPTYTVDDVFPFVDKNYQYLLDESQQNELPIIFMGDSAGAGLALAFAQELKSENRELPDKIILLSPWLDVSNSNGEMKNIQEVDVLLEQELLAFQGEIYAGLHSVNDPKVSPIYGEFAELPPIFIFTGSYDILSVDTIKLQQLADENEWDIQTFYFDKMIHTFMLLPSPEGKEALEIIYQILNTTDFE